MQSSNLITALVIFNETAPITVTDFSLIAGGLSLICCFWQYI
jgi:hypothetical protein